VNYAMRERARKAAWFQANRAKRVEAMRLRRTGLTPEAFQQMLDAQGGRCRICGDEDPGGNGSFCVDHDHRFESSDPIGHRGLLCVNCNHGLGKFFDSPEILRAAAKYLDAWDRELKRRWYEAG
jgi:hypothetical protein